MAVDYLHQVCLTKGAWMKGISATKTKILQPVVFRHVNT